MIVFNFHFFAPLNLNIHTSRIQPMSNVVLFYYPSGGELVGPLDVDKVSSPKWELAEWRDGAGGTWEWEEDSSAGFGMGGELR